MLDGPAAEAVERLARSAGVWPAELIRRALRREDEAQRKEEERSAGGAAASQPGPVLLDTDLTRVSRAKIPTLPHPTEPANTSDEGLFVFSSGFSSDEEEGSVASRPNPSESPASVGLEWAPGAVVRPGSARFTEMTAGPPPLVPPPIDSIEIPVPAGGGPEYLKLEPSEDGRSVRISFSVPGRPAEPGEAAEVPSGTIRLGRPGERG